MRQIIRFFVKYPIWANSIIFIVLIFGMISFFSIKKSFFPELQPRNITVQVTYPGASPEEMEEGVTIKVEEAIKGIVGIEEVTSTSSENVATVNIMAYEDYDLDEILTEVKNSVDRINSFPVSAEKPIIFKQKPTSGAAFLGLKGNVDLITLKRTIELIEDDFLNSGLISQTRVSGFPDLEISIETREDDLIRHNLTFDQVATAVRLNNRDISGGSIKTEQEEIRIRANAKEFDPEAIGMITLRANPDGSNLLLNDVATLKRQFAETPNKFFTNNERSVSLSISKLAEEDLAAISKYLKAYVEEFNEGRTDMELFISFDFFDVLKQRLDLLMNNGMIGLALVLFTLGLFLSLRLSFWVAFGIPASFLGMFIIGSFAGITINMLSLFGMILVIGILVDDGIVIAENIYTHFEKGKSARQAAVDGTMEVLPAVFTSVSTTIIAFIPLLLLENNGFTREMAVVVIACLAFSLVEAFFVLPAHLSSERVLSRRKKRGRYDKVRDSIEGVVGFMRHKVYGTALRKLIQWKWISVTVPLVFVMLVIGLVQGGLIKVTLFQFPPFDDLQVNLVLKPGTRENITEEFLRDFQEKVWLVNDEMKAEKAMDEDIIETVGLIVGSSSDRTTSGGHSGYLNINFGDLQEMNISSFEIANRIREQIGRVPEAEKFTVGGVNRWGKPVSVALMSKNLPELELAKQELKERLDRIAALKDITDNASTGMRELELQLKPKAYFLGMTHDDITRQIRQGYFGEEVQRLQVGPDEMKVWVRYPKEDRLSISQMEAMKVKGANGEQFPLAELADYQIKRGIININHLNGKREIRVEADMIDPTEPVPPVLDKIGAEIIPIITDKYPSVAYSFEGQQRSGARTASSMQKIFPIAIISMILLITLAFRSFSQALMILLLVPLGLFCAVLGHGIQDFAVSISSVYGMIALSGVIINDAVVMLDKYNRNLVEGQSAYDAAYNAGVARFRAIVLTSITTVAGLFPLLLETSFQAQFLIPMAISLAYGVLFGTMFILFFFPVMIIVVNDIRVSFSWMMRGFWNWLGNEETLARPSREEVEPSVIENRKNLDF